MPNRANRRRFLKTAAAAGMGYWLAAGLRAKERKSPNERIAVAAIGVGGKGQDDTTDAANHADLVALCDVDANYLAPPERIIPRQNSTATSARCSTRWVRASMRSRSARPTIPTARRC